MGVAIFVGVALLSLLAQTSMGSKLVLFNILGILAVFHVVYYWDSILLSVTNYYNGHVRSMNATGVTLGDLLSRDVLQQDVGTVISVVGVVLVCLYTVYILVAAYTALFGQPVTVFHQTDRDVGYLMTPGRTKKDIANMVRQRRRVGDIPPPYPNGWYEIMRSADLATGTSKAVSLVGHHFAVFRRANGHVAIMDAYCPHLGANLGVGGIVRGNCIECPFHGWQFDGDTGQCMSIPYAEKVPSFAKTKVWPSLEINGFIFLWYDVEDRDPSYYPDEFKEIKNGPWSYKGSTVHYVNCHIEDIPENGADVAHLKTVHETGVQAGTSIDYNLSKWLGRIITHHWECDWKALPHPNEHIGLMTLSVTNKLFGRWPVKLFNLKLNIYQIGPAVVHLNFEFLFGKGAFIQTIVPEEPLMQRLTHHVFCDWWIPTCIAQGILLSGDATQIERDAIIWSNKMYAAKPVLVKEDHLITAHRRWYSQFYSENSKKLLFNKQDRSADW